jgi:hypothetical protein
MESKSKIHKGHLPKEGCKCAMCKRHFAKAVQDRVNIDIAERFAKLETIIKEGKDENIRLENEATFTKQGLSLDISGLCQHFNIELPLDEYIVKIPVEIFVSLESKKQAIANKYPSLITNIRGLMQMIIIDSIEYYVKSL